MELIEGGPCTTPLAGVLSLEVTEGPVGEELETSTKAREPTSDLEVDLGKITECSQLWVEQS